MPQVALDNVRVLELTDGISGPYCAKMLADFGAEVISIDHPVPVAQPYPEINEAERKARQLHLNTNRKSLTLDLELERGRDVLLDLALHCDIIVESMRPGMVEGLGIGYEKLSQSRPDIVMTSVTPFGQDGPYNQWNYTELTLFAMTGAMHREGLPNRYPLKYGGEIAQYFAGTTAAAATMGALAGVALTGIGDWIDISILEAMAGHPHQIGRRAPFAYSGENDLRIEPRTSAAGGREPYAVGTFRCKDGYVSFLPLGPRMWPNIAQMIGQPELREDPRFLSTEVRSENRLELEVIFQDWLDQHTRMEVFDAAQKAGIPGGPVLEALEAADNEHFRERDYFQVIEHPEHGTHSYTGLPFRLSEAPISPPSPAPLLGQHSREVLTGLLDMSEQELESLVESGVTSLG
ncbi:MAG: CoA transferase [Dehalococcoidia bacterium]|nr:CoA transferase [Dehalococcoidia bacterium]